MRPEVTRERGFTLLEVLVAFMIVALASAVLYEGGAGGVGASATAMKYMEALSLARSHLAEIGHGSAIPIEDQTVAEGEGFSYRLHITEAGRRKLTLTENDRADDTTLANAILFEIEVTESWKTAFGIRAVKLATRRFEVRTATGTD